MNTTKNNQKIKNCKNKNNISNLDLENQKYYLKIYVKTLLEIYKNLPNILCVLDKIIERRASTLMPTSSIYGGSFNETYEQVNKVINLSERKDKLLNLYVIIEKFLEFLNQQERKIIILKFVQKYKNIDVAKDVNMSERTIFRKIDKILDKIALFLINQNWNLEFLKHQVGNESWINDLYKQKVNEDKKLKKTYNKSSSSLES